MTTNGIHLNLPLELSNPPGPPQGARVHYRVDQLVIKLLRAFWCRRKVWCRSD